MSPVDRAVPVTEVSPLSNFLEKSWCVHMRPRRRAAAKNQDLGN